MLFSSTETKTVNVYMYYKVRLPCEKRIRNTVNGMLGDSLQSITLNPYVIPVMEIKRGYGIPFHFQSKKHCGH